MYILDLWTFEVNQSGCFKNSVGQTETLPKLLRNLRCMKKEKFYFLTFKIVHLHKHLFQSGLLSFMQIFLVSSESTLWIKLLITMNARVFDFFMYCLLMFSKISLWSKLMAALPARVFDSFMYCFFLLFRYISEPYNINKYTVNQLTK